MFKPCFWPKEVYLIVWMLYSVSLIPLDAIRLFVISNCFSIQLVVFYLHFSLFCSTEEKLWVSALQNKLIAMFTQAPDFQLTVTLTNWNTYSNCSQVSTVRASCYRWKFQVTWVSHFISVYSLQTWFMYKQFCYCQNWWIFKSQYWVWVLRVKYHIECYRFV